ncbi:MAG: oligosaccharide flippase family protein [Candidatus Hodarchaeota archaeon]
MIDDTKSLFYNYLHLIFGKTVGFGIIQFFSLLLLVRILEPEGYGSYALFTSVSLVISILTVWPSSSIVRYGREEFITEGSVKKTFWASYWMLLPAFILCFLLIFTFRAKLSQYIGISESYYYLIFAYILFSNLSLNIPVAFQALGKMKNFAYLPLIFGTSFLIFLVVIYINSFSVPVELVISLLIFSHLLTTIIGLWLLRKFITPICLSKNWMSKCFSYSWPMAFGGISQEIVHNVDQIVIRMSMAVTFVGIYNVAYLLQNYLIMIPMLSISLMFPLMTSLIVTKEEAKISQYIKNYAPQIVFTWALLVSFFLIFTPEIFRLFGSDYAAASFPFTILLISIAFRIFIIIESPVLASYGLIKQAVSIGVAISAINLCLDFLLIPRIGIPGAAVATTIAFVSGACARTFILKKKLGVNNFKSYPWLYPIIVSFIGSVFMKALVPRVVFLAMVIAISLLVARRSTIFNRESLAILDFIDMPILVRQTIKKVYSFVI